MEQKLQRCGYCGGFSADPKLYDRLEQETAELYNCGCQQEEEIRYVTRDMAIDAEDLSLEGQRY